MSNQKLLNESVCVIRDEKAYNTVAGSITQNSYATRTLNTLLGDSYFVSLSSNQFTLQPGRYKIDIVVPSHGVDYSQAILWSTTNSAIFQDASGLVINGLTNISILSIINVPTFTLASAHTFEVKQICSGSGASETHAGGDPVSWAAGGSSVKSIYTSVTVRKLR